MITNPHTTVTLRSQLFGALAEVAHADVMHHLSCLYLRPGKYADTPGEIIACNGHCLVLFMPEEPFAKVAKPFSIDRDVAMMAARAFRSGDLCITANDTRVEIAPAVKHRYVVKMTSKVSWGAKEYPPIDAVIPDLTKPQRPEFPSPDGIRFAPKNMAMLERVFDASGLPGSWQILRWGGERDGMYLQASHGVLRAVVMPMAA